MKNRKKKAAPRAVGPAQLETADGESVFSLTNAASSTDCTGLIQVPPENQDQLENYAEVYRFAQTEPAKRSEKDK